MTFAPGQNVGQYEILSVLGAGGMGQVYRVRNIISNRVEAMKVLLPNFTAERDLAARFIAEIRTLASLDHPNIAQLHTAFQIDNQLVMMMEFVEGFTLDQRAKQGPIPADDIIGYALQILSALSYAHGRGVVHRDIKPANIMVTAHGIVKLMDFGIAKSRTENQLTQPGTTMGSIYYMSPEQVRGNTVDGRSDLYSVGIMLYELLSGHRPFEGDTTFGVLNQQLNSTPRPPMEVNPALSRQLNDLILKALQKDPAQRFQSADDFRSALRATTGKPPSPEVAATVPMAMPAPPPDQAPVPNPQSGAAAPVESGAAAAGIVSRTPSSGSGGAQRVIWVSVGAFAVLAVLVAAAVGLPHLFKTRASSKNASAPAQTTPIANPPADQIISAQSASAQTASVTPPVVSPSATPSTVPESSPPPPPASASAVQKAAPTAPTVHPPSHSQVESPTQPSQRTGAPRPQYIPNRSATQAATAGAPPSNSQPTVLPGSSPQEIEQATDRRVQLDSRSAAVSASLDNLQRQQEAQGYSIRQDIAGAAARMRTYLRAADADLQRGDAAAAQKDMDRADKEISTLEAFFHK
jgi:eukaryotic-like serine/threonine-protein kinase